MKITLTRKINLKKAEAVLSIKREILRPDIQEYLNGKGFADEILDKGIKKYLRSAPVGIYDENNNLTQYGHTVKNTGVFKIKEIGKYQIWIDDRRIMIIKRISPVEHYEKGPRNIELQLNEDGHISLPLPDSNEEYCQFEIKDYQIPGGLLDGTDKIKEIIEIKDNNESSTTFEGSIIKNIILPKNVEFENASLYDMLEKILSDLWNKNTNRYKIKINNVLDENDLESFITNTKGTWEPYNVEIERLPIEPYDKDEAIKWRDKLLITELENQYFHPGDFYSCVSQINDKKGFKTYENQLDIPDISQCINKIDNTKKRSDRSEVFWHLSAPYDLNVGIPKHLQLGSFSLEQGIMTSFDFIVKNNFRPVKPEKIFYYDRFVYRFGQQRSVISLLNSFNSSGVTIITNKNPPPNKNGDKVYFNNLFEKKTNFKIVDLYNEVFRNGENYQHDRFLVLKTGDELEVWTCTNSIDFIKFDIKGDVLPPTTEGKVEKSITYTKVDQKILGKELLNYIKEN